MADLDKLAKLAELRDRGIVDEAEFQREKARILAEPDPPRARRDPRDDRGPAPESNLVWGVLATILCFLPFGIVAIVKAGQVETLWARGDDEAARAASESAKGWSIAAAGTGLLLMIIVLAMGGFER